MIDIVFPQSKPMRVKGTMGINMDKLRRLALSLSSLLARLGQERGVAKLV
jgi:hypothetical protein